MVIPKIRSRRNVLKPRAMLLWLRGRSPRRRHSRVESGGCKLHAALSEADRHCSHRLLLRKVAPFPLSYLEAGAQTLDNGCKVACCIPSKPRFVGSEAARQSIHEPED